MKKLFALVVMVAFVAACATTPMSPMKTVYASQQSLIVAEQAVVDTHAAGVLVGENYDKAVALSKAAHSVLNDARKAAAVKDAATVDSLLVTLDSLLVQIATYNGGKR